MLVLPVNKHFFNEVKEQYLEEDYRAIKPYWIKKLLKKEYQFIDEPIKIVHSYIQHGDKIFKTFKEVKFVMGYDENSPSIVTNFISMRLTRPEEMTCMGRGIAFAIKIGYKS